MAEQQQQGKQEVPKYRITEKCYHFDKIYDPQAQPSDDDGNLKPLYMDFTGRPAHYMEPANEAAREMARKYPPTPWADPITRATALTTEKTL